MAAKREREGVLIGTTLGEASDTVVASGIWAAKAIGATVHLVHAFEKPPLVAGGPLEPNASQALAGRRETAAARRRSMEEQIERLRIPGSAAIVRHVEEGAAEPVLHDAAVCERAELIVVGIRDTRRAPWIGSTAARVVRTAPCPVLVLCGHALTLPPRRVLMPIDMSPASDAVVRQGLALLDRLGARPATARCEPTAVEALYVIEPTGSERFLPHFDLDGAIGRAAARLGAFLAAPGREDWRIACHAAFGGPREEILRRIEAVRPDLVVMGTHGLRGIERFVLGSVAEGVLRTGRSNVHVIPTAPARGAADVADAATESGGGGDRTPHRLSL